MRWIWWRPRPGNVRVTKGEWIRLLEGARATAVLEHETAAVRSKTRRLEAESIARVEAIERAGAVLGREVLEKVLADPPAQADGNLHEAAFRAWLDVELWRVHEQAVADLLAPADPSSDTGGGPT